MRSVKKTHGDRRVMIADTMKTVTGTDEDTVTEEDARSLKKTHGRGRLRR
jgi:hypothetical protein